MLKNFLSKKKITNSDFLKELKSKIFNELNIEQLYKNNDIDLNWQNETGETMLHLCCKSGYYESVKWLLNNGANIEAQTNEGETPIFYSIQAKDRAVMNTLLEYKANVNHLNNFRRTVLQEAVISASNKFIDLLISKTTNLNNCDIHGNNLIFDAIANGSENIINKIAQIKEVDLNQINHEGHTVLHKDIILKNNSLAMKLLEYGADPTIIDKTGKNFLFYAVSKGYKNIEILRKAVQKGCNINSKSSNNTTILMESIDYFLKTPKEDKEDRKNHIEMVKELIKLGVNASSVDDKNENAFFKATRSHDEELIEILLKNREININHRNIHGDSAFSLLVFDGVENLKLIKRYLEAGANPNIQDKEGKSLIEILIDVILFFQSNKKISYELEKKVTRNAQYPTVLNLLLKYTKVNLKQLNSKGEPLFFEPLLYFNFSLFKLLNRYGIDINQKDTNGNNIIFKLMEYEKPTTKDELKIFLSTIQSLINIGVNINTRNSEGQTVLHKAVLEKNEYIFKLFIKEKVNIMAKDNHGRTVMHLAILKNSGLRYIKLILHYDQNIVNESDRYGFRPINYAAFMGKKDIVIFLLDEGVIVNNTEPKDPKMVELFRKYHKNVLTLANNVEKELDRLNLNLLIETMKKEFDIQEEE